MRTTFILAAIILGLGLATGSTADPIQVTTGLPNAASGCTLADAVATALAGSHVSGCTWNGDPHVKLTKGQIYELGSLLPIIDASIKISGDFSVEDKAVIRWQGNAMGRFFDVSGSGSLDLTHVTLDGGQDQLGGALRVQAGGSATLGGVRIVNSVATSRGGAIYNEGDLNVDLSTFEGNQATLGGALHNGSAAYSSGQGTMNITTSLLVGNQASFGGALYQNGDLVSIENTTFSANTSTYGGALHSKSGITDVDFSTFRNNQASAVGGTIAVEWGDVNLGRSVLTTPTGSEDLCWGSFYIDSNGGNAFSDPSCLASGASAPPIPDQMTGSEITMSELVNHGGLTKIHAPKCQWVNGQCASPIVDELEKDDCFQVGAAARDQRDQDTRWNLNTFIPGDEKTCDVGAYESICESHTVGEDYVSITLHEYQVSPSLLDQPILLDSGACFIHPSCNPAEGCTEITWRTDLGRIFIRDALFLDSACVEAANLDCFDDPDACWNQCPGTLPEGWVKDPNAEQGELTYQVSISSSSLRTQSSGMNQRIGPLKSSGGGEELHRYLLELEDSQNPGETWRWDPQTPVVEDDVVE